MAMATAMATATATATETETETAMARRAGLLLSATTLLAACATVDSESAAGGACPTLAHYPAEFRERAAAEIEQLPEDSAIVGMLSDYAAMREQTRACMRGGTPS